MNLFLPGTRFFTALMPFLIALSSPSILGAEPATGAENSTEVRPLSEALIASGFKSFAEIVSASGIQAELGDSDFTCFAPTDEAVAAMPPAQLKRLRDEPKSKESLHWIKYHFIKSEICRKSNFGIIREIITWAALPTYLSVTPTKMTLNDVSVIVSFDLPAKHGVIHGISKVLDSSRYEREEPGAK